MKKNAVYGVVLVALLGGAGFLYWDDIAPLIGMGAPEPPVAARPAQTDTAPAQLTEPTIDEYKGKLNEIFAAIGDNEGKFLFGGNHFGYSANIAKLAISYPAELQRANLELAGKARWAHTDELIEFFWRLELKGKPVGDIIACNSEGGQIQDVAARKSYNGLAVAERLWYEVTNPLWLLPQATLGFDLTKVERGEEDGVIKLTLEPGQSPENGFCALRAMVIEVEREGYALRSYTLKMYVDGKLVTHTVKWEKNGESYRITTDNGALAVKGERTPEEMVLACAGENPATYTFSYGDSGVTGITVAMKRDGIDYALELTDMVPVTESSLNEANRVGADFKNPSAAGAWGMAKLGWPDPSKVTVPADEETGEGEAADTTARASADTGTEEASGEDAAAGEGDEDPNAEATSAERPATPARGEQASASASRPAAGATAARPQSRPAETASEDEDPNAEPEEATPAPRPRTPPRETARPAAAAARPATPPRETAQPAATRPAATGGTATAVRRTGGQVTSAYTRGAAAYRDGRHLEAERQLLTAVRQQPGNAAAQLMLGEIYYGRGDYGRAHTYLSRAAQLSPRSWTGTRAQQLLHRMGYPY